MASRDSQINKPQCGCPKRAELQDVNIKTGVQSINTERASLGVASFRVVDALVICHGRKKSVMTWVLASGLLQLCVSCFLPERTTISITSWIE